MVAIMGIGANPAQIKALLEFKSPTSRKKVQKLFRALSILGRFIFQYIDRLWPLFNIVWKAKSIEFTKIVWTSLSLDKAIFN